MRPPRILGVPLHPLLVHFPIVFWLAAPVFDAAALYAGPEPWWTLALGTSLAGVVFGAFAIAAGLLEYLDPTLTGIDMRLAARHGVRTTVAWCIFAAKLILLTALPPTAPWIVVGCLIVDLIACTVLVQGIYFGTKQVYQQLETD